MINVFRRALPLSLAIAASSLAACSSNNAPSQSASAAPTVAASAAASATPHETDEEFVQAAARIASGRYAIGALGLQRAHSGAVRALAKKIAGDGAAASRWIADYAKRHKIDIKKQPRTRAMYQYARLSSERGAAFDKGYARAVITDAGLSVGRFEEASRNAKDPALRAFAGRIASQLNSESKTARSLGG